MCRWKKLHNAFAEDFDPLQLDNDATSELIGKFFGKHKDWEQSTEERVEQLERRITEMDFDLIRTKSKCHAYEVGLLELSEVNDMNSLKDHIYQLQIIAGKLCFIYFNCICHCISFSDFHIVL